MRGRWTTLPAWPNLPPTSFFDWTIAPASTTATTRVLLWNVGRGLGGWEAIADDIRKHDADLIGLVEAGEKVRNLSAFWREHFPSYDVSDVQSGMVLMARGRIEHHETGLLSRRGRYRHFTVSVSGAEFDVVILDFKANPFFPRRPTFEGLERLLTGLQDRPVVVMGDFNTPPDSVWFQGLRPLLTPAFESAGEGYAPTWPVPLPVLTLDQIWASGNVAVGLAEAGWSWRSDHRPVIAELVVAEGAPSTRLAVPETVHFRHRSE